MRDRARYSIPRHAGKLEPLEPRMLLSSTPIVVDDLTDRDDDNTGAEHKTLRDAIAEAAATPGADTITFSETAFGTAPVTIQLVQGALMIDDPDGVTIQGPGADLLTIQGDGGNAVFDLPQRNGAGIASQFTLSRMKLSGGTYGLNIRPANGDHQVELDQLLISDNTTGGIHSLGDLRVANSAIVENDGVGISSSLGDLVVVNTTVSGNRTATGATAGIYSGFRTNTTLRNVTVTNNHALADETDPALISEAQAIEAGLWSVVTLHNSIVTDNYAGQSPVIMADLDYYDYTQPGPPDGRIDPDSSFNLIGYAAAGAFSPNNATNLVGVPGGTDNPDAKLAPLASNGSPLKTHALLPGSDAINAGSEGLALESDGATPLEYDQRGRGNPRVLGPAVDIGAFEALYEPALHLTANPDVTSIDETASTVAQIVATITPHQLGSDFAPSDFVLRGADADLFEVVTHADAPFALRLRAGQPIDFGISPVLDVTVETVSAGVTYAAGFSLPVNALYPSIPTTQISQGLQDAIRDSLGFTDADRPLQTGDLARVIELYGDPAQIGDLEGLAQLVNLERLVLAPRSFDTAGGPLELGPSVKNDLGNLTYVQIQGAGITDAGLAALADWLPTGVETLDLLYNEVTSLPSDLLASNRLPDLQELRLHGNPIAEPGRALANEDGTNNPLEALKGSLVQLDIVSADPDLAVYAEGENDPVKDLARRLYYLPTRMFEWVRNNVELDIYHGFIRSAQAVLETRRANDFDTALLLKELLEHSGFTYGTDLHLRYSLVDAPASAVKHWLGVQNTEAALDVLGLMSPKDDLPSLANDDSIVFNHAYLEWRPTPNGATLVLDPSWKFKDLASEAHELLRNLHRDHDLGVDGELKFEENDFNHADDSDRDGNNLNDGFLDRERPVDASDFYADQVRRHLAANYTGSTVAEVSYDGPIIPVAVSDLGTPLHDWSRVDTVQLQSVRSGSNLSVSANTVVDAYLSGDRDLWVDLNADPQTLDPVSLAHGVAIKIAPTSATPPNTLREAIDDGFSFVALEEFARHAWVTKSTPTANGHTIRLYRDGEVYAPVQPINLASGQSEYRLIVKTYTPAAYGQDLFSYSPNLNVIRQINQLVTFGVDAGQDSVYSIARKRAEYTEAVTRRLESPFDPGVTGDLNLSGTAEDEDVTIIGALADLTQTEYQFRTREAEAKLAGLFGFVDNLTFLGLGTVTADIEDGYQIEETLQSRILPDQLWVDQSAITAVTQLIGVTETYVNENLFGAQNATSFLTGYRRAAAWISSGYEHEVIEDITNAASAASTVKAIQIANSHGSGVIEVTSLSQANALVTFQNPEPNSTEAGYNNAVGRIRQGFANGGTLISAIIPRPQDLISITDGSGSLWFGYYLDRANGKEFKISSDSIVDDINGGLTVTPVRPDSTPPIEVRTNQTTGIGDPVNPADGHVYHVETDVVIPNQGVPIAFARKYQSTHVDDDLYYDSDRGLGRGWSFS
ncbi:MAG: choice-of-anchor Q domain-containing protein, partial [Planctomycetota bacterium]